jgi:HPt (histidine-containing phosphotransfer) domain-containing protein
MGQIDIPPYLEKAFSIFKEEFGGNMAQLRQLMQKIEQGTPLESTGVDAVINLLHKIKGGASFLQLDDIAQTARTAETYARDTGLTANDAGAKINGFIVDLESHLAKLQSNT